MAKKKIEESMVYFDVGMQESTVEKLDIYFKSIGTSTEKEINKAVQGILYVNLPLAKKYIKDKK